MHNNNRPAGNGLRRLPHGALLLERRYLSDETSIAADVLLARCERLQDHRRELCRSETSGSREGSYGIDGDGNPRPQGATFCLPQELARVIQKLGRAAFRLDE